MTPGPRTIELDWPNQKDFLQPDGSLRDICVVGTTEEDWSKVLTFLERGSFQAILNDFPLSHPENVSDLFVGGDRPLSLLTFRVSGIELACHFFAAEEIEFDFEPEGVGEAALRALLGLMADLGELTGKVVLMTPENVHDRPVFAYEPAQRRVSWVLRDRMAGEDS